MPTHRCKFLVAKVRDSLSLDVHMLNSHIVVHDQKLLIATCSPLDLSWTFTNLHQGDQLSLLDVPDFQVVGLLSHGCDEVWICLAKLYARDANTAPDVSPQWLEELFDVLAHEFVIIPDVLENTFLFHGALLCACPPLDGVDVFCSHELLTEWNHILKSARALHCVDKYVSLSKESKLLCSLTVG